MGANVAAFQMRKPGLWGVWLPLLPPTQLPLVSRAESLTPRSLFLDLGLLSPLCPLSGSKATTQIGPAALHKALTLFVPRFPPLQNEEVGPEQGLLLTAVVAVAPLLK